MNANRSDVLNGLRASAAPNQMIGQCRAIRAVRQAVRKLAKAHAPILITGETGTGKELVARLIHASSDRAQGPFIAVNCAALPASLFQSEVFGYEKGAFTGAFRRNIGRIDAAQGGTLFLDEIGDLSLEMQVVLLRFLQEGVFERLGSVTPHTADVRIVAATHCDLKTACEKGRFREDLYYRLDALHIQTPPLRGRGADIELLAKHFITEIAANQGLEAKPLSDAAVECLRSHDWPGNVRELRNCLRQAMVMSEGSIIEPQHLDLPAQCTEINGSKSPLRTLQEWRFEAEKKAISLAMDHAGGQVEAAAKLLQISRAQLYRLIDKHGEAVRSPH